MYISFNSPDTETNLQETTKAIHVEVVTRKYITTASTDEKSNQTLTYDDSVIYDEINILPILAGILIPITIFCMICVIYKKGKTIDFGFFILLNLFHILQHVVAKKMIDVITINSKWFKLKMLLRTKQLASKEYAIK